jgi:hypothetical protein
MRNWRIKQLLNEFKSFDLYINNLESINYINFGCFEPKTVN